MSSHKLPAESICFSVSNPNFCLRPRFCEVLASRSRNLRQLGEVDYVSKGYQILPHSPTKKKNVHFHLPFTRLCSCGCFPVCRHRPICMALESVVGQNILIQQRPTRGLFQTLNQHHRYSTIPAGRHCGLGPGCTRWFMSSCKTPIMVVAEFIWTWFPGVMRNTFGWEKTEGFLRKKTLIDT